MQAHCDNARVELAELMSFSIPALRLLARELEMCRPLSLEMLDSFEELQRALGISEAAFLRFQAELAELSVAAATAQPRVARVDVVGM